MNPNEAMLADVAMALDGLDVTFVGGVVVGLHLDELGPAAVRPTTDVDCVVLSRSALEHSRLEADLRRRGLHQPIAEAGPICRWRTVGGTVVDVVPCDPSMLGFGESQWYALAHEQREERCVGARSVRIANPALLLAMKLDAFQDRGRGDPWESRDLEDIVSLLGGCSRLVTVAAGAPAPLRRAVASACADLARHPNMPEWVAGHAPRGEGVVPRALRRLRELAAL